MNIVAPPADNDNPRTIPCPVEDCIHAEHDIDDVAPEPIHVAAKAEHGDLQLEVFLQIETGKWKLDIYADFGLVNEGVTYQEAVHGAAQILQYATLVEILNRKAWLGRDLGATATEVDAWPSR
ncbi:hypothetical protein [Agromyces subbeticus]|uniref:hypothetical protein n=1 Tax=Agromyces subbeticus TaxID=293890 RepID=UPI0003B66CBF|nr:hypothetical protein [Agromyces subbeticus]